MLYNTRPSAALYPHLTLNECVLGVYCFRHADAEPDQAHVEAASGACLGVRVDA